MVSCANAAPVPRSVPERMTPQAATATGVTSRVRPEQAVIGMSALRRAGLPAASDCTWAGASRTRRAPQRFRSADRSCRWIGTAAHPGCIGPVRRIADREGQGTAPAAQTAGIRREQHRPPDRDRHRQQQRGGSGYTDMRVRGRLVLGPGGRLRFSPPRVFSALSCLGASPCAALCRYRQGASLPDALRDQTEARIGAPRGRVCPRAEATSDRSCGFFLLLLPAPAVFRPV